MTPLRVKRVSLEPDPDGCPVALCTVEWNPTHYAKGAYWAIVATCPYPPTTAYPKPAHKHYHGGGGDPRAFFLGHRTSDCMPGGVYNLALDPAVPIVGPEVAS